MSVEEWRPVVGWEGLYEVSDAGRVRSLPRRVRGGNGSHAIRGDRILTSARNGKGYERVSLSGGSRQNASVHRLVLEAFAGPPPAGTEARHLDGNPSNNDRRNLAWGTATENWADRRRHGTARTALTRGACRHGHPWTESNTYLDRKGRPTCRTCRREGMRRSTRT